MSEVNEMTLTKTIRMTTDFSSEAYSVLKKVALRLESSKAESLRRALALIDLVQRRQAEGCNVVIEDPRGKREVLPSDWLNPHLRP